VCEDALGRACEDDQEIEFLGSEMDGFAADGNGVGLGVDDEITDFQMRFDRLGVDGAAQVGADAGEKLGHAEGFGEIVVSTFVECGDFHLVGLANAKDDDGGLRNFAHGLGELDAVHFRHGEIGDDEFRAIVHKARVRFHAIVCDGDFVPAALQGSAEHAGYLRLIVYDEDAFQCASWVTIWRSTCGASDINF